MSRSSVHLPLPLGPTIAATWRSGTSNPTPSRATSGVPVAVGKLRARSATSMLASGLSPVSGLGVGAHRRAGGPGRGQGWGVGMRATVAGRPGAAWGVVRPGARRGALPCLLPSGL